MDSTPTHDLHRRFRTIITLLTLVTAINNGGQPSFSVGQRRYPGVLEETLQIRDRLLNSIATLLVRNHDNIATAVNNSYKVLAFRLVSVEQEDNIDDDDNYAFVDNLYLLVEKGKSHIGERFGDWNEFLAIPENDPFPNHVATLEDFLHKFSKTKCKFLATNFSKYLVARCWKKMHRRITHQFSQFSIRHFFFVDGKYLREGFGSCPFRPSLRQDTMLGGLLQGNLQDEKVLKILKRLCPDHKMLPDIDKLVAAFESNLVVPKPALGTGWYTIDICHEFHKLYVSSLIAYANSLRILSRAHFKLKSLQKVNTTGKTQLAIDALKIQLPGLFEQVWRCMYLLWCITDSRILRHHLKLLLACQYLPSPSNQGVRSENVVFGRITEEWELEVVPEGDQDNDAGPVEEGKESGREDEESENEDEGSEGEEFNSTLEHPGLDKSFMRWMQLQVAYRLGQDILTSKSHSSILQALEISIITAKYPSELDREMDPWDTLLRSQHLQFPQGFDREAAIEVIREQVRSRIGQYCHSIFQRFQLQNFQLEFPGHLHCNMVLPLLARLARDPVSSNALGRLAKYFDDSAISISKLCCPVCWDTLHYLTTDGKISVRGISVRGHHCVLSPVQLPYLLPLGILEKMVVRYKGILQAEVMEMMAPTGKKDRVDTWNDLQTTGMKLKETVS